MADLEDIWRRYLACCNDRRLDDLGAFVHDPIRFNDAVVPLADYARAIASNIEAVPDLRWAVDALAVTGDTVAVRLTDTGTPRRAGLGAAPTGRSFTTREFAFYHLREGKIAAMWFVLDVPAVHAQLA